jgi:nucleoside-diphosphate-sugar epimerase
MRIAILGATSQIAGDLIQSLCSAGSFELYLYARRPNSVIRPLTTQSRTPIKHVGDYDSFGLNIEFDVLINFIGVGNPAAVAKMGADIFDITWKFDELALNYIRTHSKCRYIFLSSGSAYGSDFDTPAQYESNSKIPVNNLTEQNWYGVAKLHAECRHRSNKNLSIIDFRVFNYFSASQDIESNFLISDIIRSIRDKMIFETASSNIYRDYLHPHDFFGLFLSVLKSPPSNDVIDCYSRAPIDKISLLTFMRDRFGLKYELSGKDSSVNSTGMKTNYYSLNKNAEKFGYLPTLTSLEGVALETEIILSR